MKGAQIEHKGKMGKIKEISLAPVTVNSNK